MRAMTFRMVLRSAAAAVLGLASLGLVACSSPVQDSSAAVSADTARAAANAPTELINGIQWADTAGNPIQAHGGGMIKVGSYYYWFGENRQPDNHFLGVACYRSTDLVNWTFMGNALTKDSAPQLNYCWVERPKVMYNAATNKYVMWAHWENGDHYGEAKALVAVADNVAGPYTLLKVFRPYEDRGVYDGWEQRPGYMSRDCTLFLDTDGQGYFFTSSDDNKTMRIFRLTPNFQDIDVLVNTIFVNWSREAPAVFKRNGVYFIVTSGTSGWSPNQLKFSSSTSLTSGWNWDNLVGDWWGYASQPAYILPVTSSTGTTEYLYTGDRWAGAWDRPVNESAYVWQKLTFPTNDTLSMSWNNTLTINLASSTPLVGGNKVFRLKNKKSGKYLDVSGAATWDGAALVQWNSTTGSNQKFSLDYKGRGDFYLTGVGSGKVIEVPGWSQTNGTNLDQWTANDGNNQRWHIIDRGNGLVGLWNSHSGQAMQVEGGSITAGAAVEQGGAFTGTDQQLWYLETTN